jgi:acetyltransferase
MKKSLDAFFKPEAVAVVGASAKEGSVGWSLVKNLQAGGFPGPIYPVNPKYPEVLGLPAYPDLAAIGAPVSLALLAIPIRGIPGVMEECGRAGVAAAVVVATGGQEAGEEGRALEAAIKVAASRAGVRYLGSSSFGVLSPHFRLNASLTPQTLASGSLAFISQSGALCFSIPGWARQKNLGFSHFISVGAMADVDFGDLIDYLGNEEKARSIILYLESLKDPRKFMSAARSVARIKPIIVVKAGRSRAGARAAASHTGTLAGEDAAYSAAFRRAGMVRVDTIGQLFDCAEALGKVSRPTGTGLAIITNAGGSGVMAVDALSRWDLEPAGLAPETLARLDATLPPNWSRGNPIDILGLATPDNYRQAVRVCLEAPEFAGLVVILSPQALTDPTGVARALAREAKGQPRPVFAVWMGGEEVAPGSKILNDAGIPTFETPEQAVDTFMEVCTYSRNLELLQETPPRLTHELKVNTAQARSFLDHCLARRARVLTELESKAILSAYGLAVNPTVAAAGAGEAAAAARDLGFPVVLKINSPEISHKTGAGGVRFGLASEAQVRAAYEDLVDRARELNPGARILGVTVQTQEEHPDLELILGSKQDPGFGPLILFGLGGVYAEVLQDWAVDLPPLNLLLAQRLLARTRVYRALEDYQRVFPDLLPRLAEILVRLSQLVTDFPEIRELDVNPVLLTEGKIVAVDARIIIEPRGVPAPRHLIIAPYPNQYESHWMLRDGTPVFLRPMRPEDESLVADFLNKCSEDTVYFRYFKLIRHWTHDMLIRFTQNDYDRELGLMAMGQPPGPEVMLGVGRLYLEPDREQAEFAVIVADPWQGKGLGPKLLEEVIHIAREMGARRLAGEVLAQNQPMLEMVKKAGFTLKKDPEGGTFRAEMVLRG